MEQVVNITKTNYHKSFHVQLKNFMHAIATKRVNISVMITVWLTLTAFSIPVSVTLKGIFLALAALSIVIHHYGQISSLLRQPWFYATVALYAVIVLGCLYGPSVDVSSKWNLVHKYSKLLLLPIFALGFQNPRNRVYALHAYLFAMCITVFCSVGREFGYLQSFAAAKLFQNDFGAIFYNHIITGYFIAIACYISAILALRTQGLRRMLYFGMTCLYSYHLLFMNPGRTGYLLFAILALMLFVPLLRRAPFKWSFFLVCLSLIMLQSPLMKKGIEQAVYDTQHYIQGEKNSSVGFRLQFHSFAEKLFLTQPWIGLGTGSFSYYFHQDNPVPAWGDSLFEPHGEYWLFAAEHGVIGLGLLLIFMLTLFTNILRQTSMRLISFGLFATFFMVCFSEGMLLLSVPGYFFIFFIAMGLGESLAHKQHGSCEESECISP